MRNLCDSIGDVIPAPIEYDLHVLHLAVHVTLVDVSTKNPCSRVPKWAVSLCATRACFNGSLGCEAFPVVSSGLDESAVALSADVIRLWLGLALRIRGCAQASEQT